MVSEWSRREKKLAWMRELRVEVRGREYEMCMRGRREDVREKKRDVRDVLRFFSGNKARNVSGRVKEQIWNMLAYLKLFDIPMRHSKKQLDTVLDLGGSLG
jgi:hypothetical protein